VVPSQGLLFIHGNRGVRENAKSESKKRNYKTGGSDFTHMGILLWKKMDFQTSFLVDDLGLSENALHPLTMGVLLFLTALTLVPCNNYVNSTYFYPKLQQAHEPFQLSEKSLFQDNWMNLLPHQIWNRTYGQSSYDRGHAIVECQTGGYAITGVTQQGVDASDLLFNIWVLRLDMSGNLLWRSSFGGESFDEGYDIVECPDGGFAILGYTVAPDSMDMLLVRTDYWGNLLWNRTYDSGNNEVGYTIIRCRVGGYAIIGRIEYTQAWLLRLDEDGNPLWNQTYDTSPPSADDTLVECWDGGFAFLGSTDPAHLADTVLFRTDTNGILLWNETYGGAGNYFSRGLVQCRDRGFAMVGGSRSLGNSDYDIWLVRTNPFGAMIWNTSFGGAYNEHAESVAETQSGGFALTGSTILRSGFYDISFIMANPSGEVLLNWTFGGNQHDRGYSLTECRDRGFAITGATFSAETGWDVLFIRIPSDVTRNILQSISWIGITIVLPLLVSIITVWLGFRLLRSKQTLEKRKNHTEEK
jgi:hypothetical protein